jgi:hypothetical protein
MTADLIGTGLIIAGAFCIYLLGLAIIKATDKQ